MRIVHFVVALTLLFFPFSACPQTTGDARFQLMILNPCWDDMQLGYDWQRAFPILCNADLKNTLFVVCKEEIKFYDWDAQVITLTRDATRALWITLNKIKPLSKPENVRDRTNGSVPENGMVRALDKRIFVVRVNGVTLYGGIFLHALSQMAIGYPVIRAAINENCMTFALLPAQIPFVMFDPVSVSATKDGVLFSNELEEDVNQLNKEGFITKMIMNLAKSEKVNSLREVIKDERIRSVVGV